VPTVRTYPIYVLVTPVRDEAATIGRTIAAVTRQSVKPLEWVIVSDGSTDGTDEIVARASAEHPWIRLIGLAARPGRSFAAVVQNTEIGLGALTCDDYAFVGLLDADLDFQDDYFEMLLRLFDDEPRLGLAGGVVIDPGREKDRFPRNRIDVPGAVQFFRRECFEQLGGLVAIPEGGWDCLTCAMARMHGFETRLVTELVVNHLKPRNVSQGGMFRRLWQLGVRDYAIGYDPLFELLKCIGRVKERPRLIAGLAHWMGYCATSLKRPARVVPAEIVKFVQEEQRTRMRRLLLVRRLRQSSQV
jgi:biofilm PGA synthesis N-glycosyltransferase PgaC